MGEHALLSASSAHRWLKCTPSPRLEQQFEEQTSAFAEEGTAAHELAEYKVRRYLGQECTRPESKYSGDEMDRCTDEYVEYAAELISQAKAVSKDPVVLVEQKLDFSCYVPEGFGTGDLVIVSDSILEICDLKYGKGVQVSATDNPQMKLYAIGALNLFGSLYDIKTVRMHIFQPRLENISTYEMNVEDITKWAETELKGKAQLAIKGEGEFVPGEHCRFCRARHTCRARADSFLEMAKYDFKPPHLLSDDEIAELLEKAQMLSQRANDVWAYAAEAAINDGKQWKGYKIVEGRTNRKYADEQKVADTLITAGYNDIYKKSLLGISEMEKKIGKNIFSQLLNGLVVKPAGEPKLVPESDKRSAINTINTAEADFINN
jgi:hypothetical protein